MCLNTCKILRVDVKVKYGPVLTKINQIHVLINVLYNLFWSLEHCNKMYHCFS